MLFRNPRRGQLIAVRRVLAPVRGNIAEAKTLIVPLALASLLRAHPISALSYSNGHKFRPFFVIASEAKQSRCKSLKLLLDRHGRQGGLAMTGSVPERSGVLAAGIRSRIRRMRRPG